MTRRMIALWMCITAGMIVAQTTFGQAVHDGLNKKKLLDAEKIIRSFEQGGSVVKVSINLSVPLDISRTNWRSATFRTELRKEIHNRQQRVIETLPESEFRLRQRFQNLPGFSADVTLDALKKLSNNPLVESIEPVFLLEPHLSQGINLMNALATRSTYNGQGVSIAICDSGIDYTHPALGGGGFPNAKVIGGYDIGDNDSDPVPEGQAHGTSCAGIAAGDVAAVGDYIGGVAYGSKLYALKITAGSSDAAYNDDMAAAWDWCVSHQYDDPNNPILVISTSFGSGRYFSSCNSSSTVLTNAANTAAAAGITLLVSSGNDGYCDSLSLPACISSIISVGAVWDAAVGTYDICVNSNSCADADGGSSCGIGEFSARQTSGADVVTVYSNTALFLDVLAPSHLAYTTDISGSGGYASGDYVTNFGGTSAACPYAAGVVAILQSASKAITGDFFTPDELRDLLTSTGDAVADEKVPTTIKPRINVANAMTIFTEAPPTASDVYTQTQPDTIVTITLQAADEGLPDPPGALSYIITTLPNHGQLADPAAPATPIAAVPYLLSGDQVNYTPRTGCTAPVTFTYIASDGGIIPDGGDSNEATVNVSFTMDATLYFSNMDTSPGWTLDGLWAWGTPAGGGGENGNPDPISGFNGTNVAGYNLAGDYAEIGSTQWATTPAIDCTDKTEVKLTFYRWLNVGSPNEGKPPRDHAYIGISNDGIVWNTIWENTTVVTDSSWQSLQYDISAYADNQPTVYIRWGIGPTNNRDYYSGWNIDDVQIMGVGTGTFSPLIGDLEPDCDVDVNDLMRMIDYWLATCGDCDGADLVEDSVVNLPDLAALAQNWLAGL